MINLTFLKRRSIEYKKDGLTEPSGLTLAHDGKGLWTVSDDSKGVFHLSLSGGLRRKKSFPVPDDDLEGITIEPSGRFLFVVREESNEVIKLDIAGRRVADRRTLADMTGYGKVRRYFEDDEDDNDGLEGLTWCAASDSLFALKEGAPGLLLEIAPDLRRIIGHTLLNARRGFVDPSGRAERIDFSGIDYDQGRGLFWILSDEGRRVFLYDPAEKTVVQSLPLTYGRNGKPCEVEKAEGIAYDSKAGRLYIVSDEEVRLYVFDVRA